MAEPLTTHPAPMTIAAMREFTGFAVGPIGWPLRNVQRFDNRGEAIEYLCMMRGARLNVMAMP